MTNKLYVGNLSYNTTGETLEKLFAQAGKVDSVNVITDAGSGRSKGFGFVEMSSPEEAKKAVEMFNGQEVDERNIRVDEARPKQ
jgi:RNA recognition motif-containing protein